jgi:methyl-accepting chemotaxis protein
MKEMTSATANTTKQLAMITRANKERADASAAIVGQLREVRRVTERNAAGVKAARGSTGQLVARAETLRTLMAPTPARRNGGRARTSPESR